MIVIGLLFFSISSIVNDKYIPEETKDFIMFIIKYFITVICGYELLKNTTTREITLFLCLGALTILMQILLFNNPLIDYGRYSGFYLNPNVAGFICLVGYGMSFANQNKNFRLFLQIVFTIMGLLTFSRTFILLWLLTNLISIKIDIKNSRVLLYGFGLLTAFVIFGEFLPVKNPRLDQMSAILKGEKVKTTEINEDSRTETWSLYYDALLDHPILGNGYNSFSGESSISSVGVHNSFLKIWGEAGIFVFILFIIMYLLMIKQSLQLFEESPHLFLIVIAVILFLTTNHNFFDNGYILFISMWIQAEISKHKIEEQSTEIISE
ncbi:O-antigen ligase family protein [Arenibacter antarcticus]|uniref:O-antigen ligase family protein n=3 Tax=Arenibacter TaxID=178469 RepID=A0ABW5VFT4_9FLAO